MPVQFKLSRPDADSFQQQMPKRRRTCKLAHHFLPDPCYEDHRRILRCRHRPFSGSAPGNQSRYRRADP
ncbi:MAG TPA: hypothetical protein DEF05_03105, partial [Erwinia sp.]|nr:hypothetical protein [Erwinia sp.]